MFIRQHKISSVKSFLCIFMYFNETGVYFEKLNYAKQCWKILKSFSFQWENCEWAGDENLRANFHLCLPEILPFFIIHPWRLFWSGLGNKNSGNLDEILRILKKPAHFPTLSLLKNQDKIVWSPHTLFKILFQQNSKILLKSKTRHPLSPPPCSPMYCRKWWNTRLFCCCCCC